MDGTGAADGGGAGRETAGIASKLSAVEPRYTQLRRERVIQRLVPRVIELARRAAKLGIQLTIDAEEADRLDLSLEVIEALARDPVTQAWSGLGLAVQAYSKRALDVIDWEASPAQLPSRPR